MQICPQFIPTNELLALGKTFERPHQWICVGFQAVMLKDSRCYESEAEHTQGTVQSIEHTTYPIFTTIVFKAKGQQGQQELPSMSRVGAFAQKLTVKFTSFICELK